MTAEQRPPEKAWASNYHQPVLDGAKKPHEVRPAAGRRKPGAGAGLSQRVWARVPLGRLRQGRSLGDSLNISTPGGTKNRGSLEGGGQWRNESNRWGIFIGGRIVVNKLTTGGVKGVSHAVGRLVKRTR